MSYNNTILPEFQHPSNHAPLVVIIHMTKEFVQNKRYTIIKNSEEKEKFIFELIKAIKKIDTSHLVDKELLKLIFQEFVRSLDLMWQKHSK